MVLVDLFGTHYNTIYEILFVSSLHLLHTSYFFPLHNKYVGIFVIYGQCSSWTH